MAVFYDGITATELGRSSTIAADVPVFGFEHAGASSRSASTFIDLGSKSDTNE
jgi:hypothetical protein